MVAKDRKSQVPEDHALAKIEDGGGWRYFMRHAADLAIATETDLTSEIFGRHPNAALGLVFYRAKMGDPVGARAAFELCYSVLPPQLQQDPSFWADLVLVDTHVAVYEDKTFHATDAERLRRAERQLRPGDLIGQALAYNHLCTIALHLGDFDKAQDHAEQSMCLYREDGAEFGSLHLHIHLGQIRMLRGDLDGAEALFQEMGKRLARLPGNTEWLTAVGRVLSAEVAYETNDLERANEMMDLAFNAVEHKDAWFDILNAAYRVRTRLAYAEAGLPGALEALTHAERIARDRNMPRLYRLMQIERIRALTLSDEINAAACVMKETGLSRDQLGWEDNDDWALRQGTTFVTAARWMVRARRAGEALKFIGPAEDFAIRGGQLLSLAKLRVIAATAHWRLGSRTEATGSLLSAIRLLGGQPFRRFILDEGSDMRFIVQAALDGDHVSVPATREQRHSLMELTHFWATNRRRGSAVDASGPDRLCERYLELLARGHSNKEIARIMGVSTNTVKYHLKQIFRDLHADNRTRAVQRARDLGLIAN